MKTYLIYHIPGKKIGCTKDLYKRMSDQGFTQWEILEEHNCIYEVSDREIQLQKDYGLPVDKVPYWKSVQNRFKWTSETAAAAGRKGGTTTRDMGHFASLKTKEHQAMAGRANKGLPKLKSPCPKCGVLISNTNLQRHIDRVISCI
tara:strand:+ start:1712 stop:2149 length:438 start_codon:yes stop_codon:yes gene_type:complete